MDLADVIKCLHSEHYEMVIVLAYLFVKCVVEQTSEVEGLLLVLVVQEKGSRNLLSLIPLVVTVSYQLLINSN